jgi:hypothetical protein
MFDVITIGSSSFGITRSLFNDAADNSYYIASNDLVVMNNEFKGKWNETVVDLVLGYILEFSRRV